MPALVHAVEIGDDGLHKQPWFALTFKDIGEDIETARQDGKRLVLMVEQRGCIYCQEVHEQLLTQPEIRDYIKENFMVVQYNLHGDEEVTDTDGEVLTEKTAARKWRLLFTPTFLFMPEETPEGVDAATAAVAVMPGAFKRNTFIEMFIWVRNKGYAGEESFQTYFNRRFNAGKAGDTATAN
ncbi:SoxW family protein [Salaquimonas pukyongi]|uniref:SoxW family protein n=1 Tax=Salaquimonas pukyongi TaxID=2712698 RepID=UPI001FCCF438|nr:thioredoxin family protein [Salaquimonas pukyongi]